MNLHPLIEPGWVNAILPELILSVGAMLLILVDAFAPRAKGILAPITIVLLTAGAWSERFVLGGTALFYGATQSTNITVMGRWFTTGTSTPLLTIAFVLLMSGFGFKLALAPFHAWAPDVYQGAPTPVSGWLSVAPKAATLIALVRLFVAFTPILPHVSWMNMVAVLSVLSMLIGNAVAIVQR